MKIMSDSEYNVPFEIDDLGWYVENDVIPLCNWCKSCPCSCSPPEYVAEVSEG